MNRHKPFIVEFTGTPEAGKTTVVKKIYQKLTDLGYKVKIYSESAEYIPDFIPKNSVEYGLWINFETFKHVMEARYQSEYDFVIFDRGSLDRLFWIYLDSVYNFNNSMKNVAFIDVMNHYPPDLLISFRVSAEESIRRRGSEGRLVTKNFIKDYNRILDAFISSIEINKVIVSTDNKKIDTVVHMVVNSILENIKESS